MSSKTKKLPEIRIKYAWLLSNAASVHLNTMMGDGSPLQSHDAYVKVAKQYQIAWQPYEKKILSAMCDLFDLEFRQNIIDVNVAPWFYAFSDPMVLGVIFDDDEFIRVLTHELLHRLLTDNTATPYETNYLKQWKPLIDGNYSKNTLIHIPVHAGLKAILLNTLDRPDQVKADIANSENYADYLAAWNYVESHDYDAIIETFKQSYV